MVRLRVRIRFSKQGDLRLIGHRDLMRCLERLFRRAGLALSFSQGFHPKPRMTFPLALAVGIEGLDEVMELELAEAITAEELLRRLAPQAPPGLAFRAVEVLPEGCRKAQRPKRLLRSPDSRRRDQAGLGERIERLLAAASWPIERARGARPIDLRPLAVGVGAARGRAARCGSAWTAAAASARATCWRRWTWPTSSGKESVCAAPPWRSAHELAHAASRRASCLQRMRARRYCRTRKRQHETGNADQRRAAGRMPHRDR